MQKFITPLIIFTILAMVLAPLCPSALAAETQLGQPTPGNTFIDALIYRPVGLVAIPVGTVLFIITIPFSALGGNVDQAFGNLVVAPAKYTFCRPLGDI